MSGKVSAARRTSESGMEWNNPEDIALASSTFQRWTDAVIAKDEATVTENHDDGFRVRFGDQLLTKSERIQLELAVRMKR